MSNEEYTDCIMKMLQTIKDNRKLKTIFEFVHRMLF